MLYCFLAVTYLKIWPRCIPCIYDVRVREILESKLEDEEKIEALREFTRYFADLITPGASTIVLATIGFRKVKELLEEEDIYREFKEKSYRIALSVIEDVRKEALSKNGYEKFLYLVKASIAGNILDPGAPLGKGPENFLETVRGLKLARDETRKLYEQLEKASKVTFLLDNAGEVVFDALLLEELKNMGLSLDIVAKSLPYQNDVTVEEIRRIGLDRFGRILGTGSDAGGIIRGMISEEVFKSMEEADLVISKGMANFESFLDETPRARIFVMLVAKCLPVAIAAGIEPGEAAAFFLRV